MKKLFTILVFMLAFVLVACDKTPKSTEESSNPTQSSEQEDTVKPEIHGTKDWTVYVGQLPNFSEGVTATDNVDEEVTVSVDHSGVNIHEVGTYEVIYTAIDEAGNKEEVKVKVTVIEQPVEDKEGPEFTGTKDWVLYVGDEMPDFRAGVKAIDEVDGEVTFEVLTIGLDLTTSGTYKVTYTATDSKGNPASVSVTVTVKTNEKPVFSGLTDITINVGEALPDLQEGVSVLDLEDGELEFEFDASNVDIENSGEYTITYTATDSDGNTVTETRKVEVIEELSIILLGIKDWTITIGSEMPDFLAGISAVRGTEVIEVEVSVDISHLDLNTEGRYDVVYTVTEISTGRIETFKSTVFVIEEEVSETSEIIPNGLKDWSISINDTLPDLLSDVSFEDADGNVLSFTVNTDSVDTGKVGTYEIRYDVVDMDGKTHSYYVKIVVIDPSGTTKLNFNFRKTLGIETYIYLKRDGSLFFNKNVFSLENGVIASVELSEIRQEGGLINISDLIPLMTDLDFTFVITDTNGETYTYTVRNVTIVTVDMVESRLSGYKGMVIPIGEVSKSELEATYGEIDDDFIENSFDKVFNAALGVDYSGYEFNNVTIISNEDGNYTVQVDITSYLGSVKYSDRNETSTYTVYDFMFSVVIQ